MGSKTATLIFYSAVVSLGSFLFGFDASVISGTVGYITNTFSLTDMQIGFVVSAPTLGGTISIIFGPISDQIGRKRVLQIISVLYLVSAICSTFAPSYQFLAIARFLGGLAFVSLALAPMYIAEMAPSRLRGKLVSISQLNIVVGFSAAYFANFFLQRLSISEASWVTALGINSHTWRWMLGLEVLPAALYTILLTMVPESPRWLILKGKVETGQKVLARVLPKERVQEHIEEIQKSVGNKLPPFFSRVKEVFGPKVRFALLIGVIVGVIQQITGINAVFFYAPTIFEQSGVGTNAAFSQAVFVGLINVVFTIIAMLCIDKLGRKPLMTIGLVGVCISLMLCAYGFYSATYSLTDESTKPLYETIDQKRLAPLVNKSFSNDVSYKRALQSALGEKIYRQHEADLMRAGIHMNSLLVLIGILGFVAFFAISLGPVTWVLLSEIFPNRLRGLAGAIVGSLNSSISYLVQLIFPWEIANLGGATTFFIYGAFALAGLALVLWLLPETKGKTLEQIETQMARGH